MPCRTSKSLTWLHHQVHSFMAHGVDPLVEIGGQQEGSNVTCLDGSCIKYDLLGMIL
jgi:hypothetical protein